MNFKQVIISLFVLLSFISCSKAQKTSFSKEALAEKIIALDGTKIAFEDILHQYKGKTIVIEVWASWCSDCIKSIPKTSELQLNNPNVLFLFISMDNTIPAWKKGINKYQLRGNHFLAPNGMKGPFGKAIDLDWIPRYIIIDKTGKIILYHATETDFEKINTTLKSLT